MLGFFGYSPNIRRKLNRELERPQKVSLPASGGGERSNQVWCLDITYLSLGDSLVYLTAVMDWSSRYVLSWKLNNSMDEAFRVESLEEGSGDRRRARDLEY